MDLNDFALNPLTLTAVIMGGVECLKEAVLKRQRAAPGPQALPASPPWEAR